MPLPSVDHLAGSPAQSPQLGPASAGLPRPHASPAGPARLEVHPLHQPLAAIQVARGAAASAVVLYHAAHHTEDVLGTVPFHGFAQWGHAAVDFFFVLSGFIIQHVHGADVGRRDRIQRFVSRRFFRVYPIFWVALVVFALRNVFARSYRAPSVQEFFVDALLLRHQSEPIVDVQWSLSLEILFYGAFALLIVHQRLGQLVLGLWGAAILGCTMGLIPDPSLPMLQLATSAYGLQFFMGMGVARLVACKLQAPGRTLALAGTLAFGLAATLEVRGVLNGYGTAARWFYGASSVPLIWGLVEWERSRKEALQPPRWLLSLGACSYSVYLFHILGIGILGKAAQFLDVASYRNPAWPPWLLGALLGLALFAAGLGLSWAVGHYFELRLLRWMRSSSLRTRTG